MALLGLLVLAFCCLPDPHGLSLKVWIMLAAAGGGVSTRHAQRIFLLRSEVGRIALTQHKPALVPENGERAGCVGVRKPDETEDERVKDFVWQRVFLV
jgi:hypothetical protein